jgi:ABC-type transporter Mla subunit MlaD
MKRRIVLAVLLSVLAVGAIAARAFAQGDAPQVPPDRVSLEEFKALRAAGKILVLDVRVGATTKIKGATYVPLDQLDARLNELPRDREIVTYCS